MNFFYFDNQIFYDLKQFSDTYNLCYDKVRYYVRTMGNRFEYFQKLDSDPRLVKALINRTKK